MPDPLYDFGTIRSACVELSKFAFLPSNVFNANDPNLLVAMDNLFSALNTQMFLSEFPKNDQKLADYIFFPIAQLLKQNITPNDKHLVTRILKLLTLNFRVGGQLENAHFKQFLPVILMLIGKKESIVQYEVVVELLGAFLECFKSFDAEDFALLAFVAQLIQVILYILEVQNLDTELRLKCLEQNLNRLLFDVIKGNEEILSFVLPGVISSLVRVLLGLSKNSSAPRNTPQILVTSTLSTLSRLIICVYNDTSLKEILPSANHGASSNVIALLEGKVEELGIEKSLENLARLNSSTSKPNTKQRDAAWLKGTKYQVLKSLETCLFKLLKRNSAHINTSLVDFSKQILLNCSESLDVCKNLLVQTTLKAQPTGQCSSYLDKATVVEILMEVDLTKTVLFQDGESELELLFSALLYLDRTDTDDNMVVIKLTNDLCSNIMNYTNSKMYLRSTKLYRNDTTILHPGINAEKLVSVNSSKIMESVSAQNINSMLSLELKNSYLKEEPVLGKFFNQDMELKMKSVFQQFGAKLDQESIAEVVETILNLFDTDGMALWIVTQLTVGASFNTSENEIIDEFLKFDDDIETETFDLVEDCNFLIAETSNDKLFQILNANEINIDKKTQLNLAASLNGINSLIDISPNVVRDELLDILPLVVECLTLSDDLVRNNAQYLITKMATVYTETHGIEELIYDNITYIVDYCGTKLRNSVFNRCSVILSVICQIGGYEMISKFNDVIETIFEVLDFHHNSDYVDVCIEIFQLFMIIVKEIKKKYVQEQDAYLINPNATVNATVYKPWAMDNISQVIDMIQYKEHKFVEKTENQDKIREVDSDDEDEYDDQDDGDDQVTPGNGSSFNEEVSDENPWVSSIPKSAYQMLVQITNYGERLLTTSNSLVLKNTIITCITECIPLLASQYDSFLPQVAQSLWRVMYDMSVENVLLMETSFKAIRLMIHYSQGFIVDRFLNLWNSYRNTSLIKQQLLTNLDIEDQSSQKGFKRSTEHNSVSTYPSSSTFKSFKNVKSEFNLLLIEGLNVSALKISDTDYSNIMKVVNSN